MKKLMIAVAIAMVAVASQAVQIKWGSLNLYQPGEKGSIADNVTWNGTKWTLGTNNKITTAGAVEAFVWESMTASDVSYKAGDLWNWYEAGKTGSPVAGGTKYTGVNSASTVTITGGDYAKNDVVHAAILYVFTDGDGNKWYMENAADGTVGTSATTISGLAIFEGGGALTESHTLMSWQSVPEPTSGLLLLIGVGALALRRRRA